MTHQLLRVSDPQQLARRNQIQALQDAILEEIASGREKQTFADGATDEGNDQAEHYFAEGVYGRGVLIPAGNIVIGRLHLHSRICVIAKGRCAFIDENIEGLQEVEAPWVGEFPAGSKTAVLALTDVYWIAFVGTHQTDPQEILKTMSVFDYPALEQLK